MFDTAREPQAKDESLIFHEPAWRHLHCWLHRGDVTKVNDLEYMTANRILAVLHFVKQWVKFCTDHREILKPLPSLILASISAFFLSMTREKTKQKNKIINQIVFFRNEVALKMRWRNIFKIARSSPIAPTSTLKWPGWRRTFPLQKSPKTISSH